MFGLEKQYVGESVGPGKIKTVPLRPTKDVMGVLTFAHKPVVAPSLGSTKSFPNVALCMSLSIKLVGSGNPPKFPMLSLLFSEVTYRILPFVVSKAPAVSSSQLILPTGTLH